MRKPPHLTSKERGTYRDDWGTPAYILEPVRQYLGSIDVDLASSAEANETVKASSYYTRDNPYVASMQAKSVWCNPPGPGKLVHYFWDTFLDIMDNVGCPGAFLFYNVDHMRNATPADAQVILLRKRVRFVGAPSGASFPSALVIVNSMDASQELLRLGQMLIWATP